MLMVISSSSSGTLVLVPDSANILSQYYIIVKVVEIHDWEIIQEDAIIQRYKSLALHLPWPPALASYHPKETCLIV